MSKSVYTTAMVDLMRSRAPLNAEVCADLASEFSAIVGSEITARSVIAKAKVEKIDYTKKQAPARKRVASSKADLVRAITKAVDADDGSLDGLMKATVPALSNLLSNL